MKGTIRIVIGAGLTMGGVGGLDNLVPIFIPVSCVITGLIIMLWGHSAMSKSLK